MWSDAHSAYLESRVLSADPIELVRLLYRAAMDAVRDARRRLEAGEVQQRAQAINKSSEVLLELMQSLDFERGGELAGRLAQLYEYMLRRLTEANFKRADAPLAEVLALLTTLSEGWAELQAPKPEVEPAQTESRWSPFSVETATAPSQTWSL
jgi:flagellar protein FliS